MSIDKALVLEAAKAGLKDLESATLQLEHDLKYVVSPAEEKAPRGHVVPLWLYHPDVMPWIVFHLTRLGWRPHPEKALAKPRRVIGSQFPDLVAWVPLDEPDDPIYVNAPEPQPLWSVKPNVTVQHEERPDD